LVLAEILKAIAMLVTIDGACSGGEADPHHQRDPGAPLRRQGDDQAELAERIGVTRQTVIAIEQGRYSPSLEVAFKIARVFAVPLETVSQYPDNRKGPGRGPRSTSDKPG
jgi:putative transcriptional regulator